MIKISGTKDMSNIEGLLKKNTGIGYFNKWHPTLVSSFERDLSMGAFKGIEREIRKNIAYSLQYLEFLQIELDELNLHSVIEKQVKKTYIITAMGILEAIFMHLVKSNGLQVKEEWSIGTPRHTNTFVEEGIEKKYIITTSIKKENPTDGKMDFEFLVNKVQEKKLLGINHKAFPRLKALKRIRNKVHLQIVRYENDTDYLSISNGDYLLMRYLLYVILKNKNLGTEDISHIDFLKIKEDQVRDLKKYLKENGCE